MVRDWLLVYDEGNAVWVRYGRRLRLRLYRPSMDGQKRHPSLFLSLSLFLYPLMKKNVHHNKPLSIINMAQLPPQPDLADLSECFNGAARQISRLQIIPAFNDRQIIIKINQLQKIARSICELGTRLEP